MTFKTMIATSAVALAVATSAMADSSTHTGFYLGGSLGYGTGKTKFDNKEAGAANVRGDLKMRGPVFGFHTGYQYQMNMFVAGLEAALNLGNTKKDTKIGAVKVTHKRDFAFGIATRLGVAVESWLLYTKLGWENANFNTNVKLNDFTLYSKNKRSNGFLAGLGVEKLFNNGIMLGGEWTYTQYKKFSMASGNVKDSFKPRIHDFKVRLGYKF